MRTPKPCWARWQGPPPGKLRRGAVTAATPLRPAAPGARQAQLALLDQVLNAGLGAFAQHCLDTVVAGLGVVYSSLRPMISPLAATWLKPYWPALKKDSTRWDRQLAFMLWMPFSQLALLV